MNRMIHDSRALAASIKGSGIDGFSERAYIFVGTARAKLAAQEAPEDDPLRIVAVLQNYVHLLKHDYGTGGSSDDTFIVELYEQFKALRQILIDKDNSGCRLLIADSILQELEILGQNEVLMDADTNYRLQMCDTCNALLNAEGESKRNNVRRARLLYTRAEILRKANHFEEAERLARQSVLLAEENNAESFSARQQLIQIAIDDNRLDDALELVEEVKQQHKRERAAAADDEKPESDQERSKKRSDKFSLATLGRLCQILKRDPDRLDQGIEVAKEGIALSRDQENFEEQAIFGLDLAQLYMIKMEFADALDAAQKALTLARRSMSSLGELSIYGTIGQCFLQLGKYAEARKYAELGLSRAMELGETRRVSGFTTDLARIEHADGQIEQSAAYWKDALEISAVSGEAALWGASFKTSLNTMLGARKVDLGSMILCTGLRSLGLMKPHTLSSSAGVMLSGLKQIPKMHPPEIWIPLFTDVIAMQEEIVDKLQKNRRSLTVVALSFQIIRICLLAAKGDINEATALAHEIDNSLGADGALVQDLFSSLDAG